MYLSYFELHIYSAALVAKQNAGHMVSWPDKHIEFANRSEVEVKEFLEHLAVNIYRLESYFKYYLKENYFKMDQNVNSYGIDNGKDIAI